MSDAARAVSKFNEAYGTEEKTKEIDFQRVRDRGLAPVGRQDPDSTVSYREDEEAGLRFKCAHCQEMNKIAHEDLEEAGYTRLRSQDDQDGADDDDDDIDPGDMDTDGGN